MPVIDGVLHPRELLTLAERQVDFAALDRQILDQRRRVEDAAAPAARRLALLANAYHGLAPLAVIDDLAERLRLALDRTARYGHAEAQQEIRRLRALRGPARAYAIPDAGEYADLARAGLDGVRTLIRRRSREVASAVSDAVTEAAAEPGLDRTARELAIADAGRRALHLNVLELVGETLNMGRTAGAMAIPAPPEFAMRSEQLDKQTCDPCTRLHGEIAQLGTEAYFRLLPPADCLGGGRCRGVVVFGDGPVDFRVPLPEAA